MALHMVPTRSMLGRWSNRAMEVLHCVLTFIIFILLDFLDAIFCIIYGYLDEILEGKPSDCYCTQNRKDENNSSSSNYGETHKNGSSVLKREMELSETLHGRKNMLREMTSVRFGRRRVEKDEKILRSLSANRWSDCGCEVCISWMKNGDLKLHVAVQEPPKVMRKELGKQTIENVLFLHGFLSSSSYWTETVFKNLSERAKLNYRLLAVDLLGFGRSPKPRDCLYTMSDHLEMIEKSVISPNELEPFHLVAHSMGCVIALALAAKYPNRVKSLSLVAPPYFPQTSQSPSLYALSKVAEKRLWPPILFAVAFMSWYEHLGRTLCFLVCRNHRIWESILRLLMHRRDLHFTITDMTRHTHHSAWHTMHNIICGGAAPMDDYLVSLRKHGVKISVIQGDHDQVVPLECSYDVKTKVPDAVIKVIPNADHSTIIMSRVKEFTQDLEHIWASLQ